MTQQSPHHHPNAVHDSVGKAVGWLLVVFDKERARIIEAAPEGIVEWEQIVSRHEVVVAAEAGGKSAGPRYGAHAQHAAAGAHQDHEHHQTELTREHARTVAAAIAVHTQRHPEARIFVAGPTRGRAILIAAMSRPMAARVAGRFALPITASLPDVAMRFRAAFQALTDAAVPAGV